MPAGGGWPPPLSISFTRKSKKKKNEQVESIKGWSASYECVCALFITGP